MASSGMKIAARNQGISMIVAKGSVYHLMGPLMSSAEGLIMHPNIIILIYIYSHGAVSDKEVCVVVLYHSSSMG